MLLLDLCATGLYQGYLWEGVECLKWTSKGIEDKDGTGTILVLQSSCREQHSGAVPYSQTWLPGQGRGSLLVVVVVVVVVVEYETLLSLPSELVN